MSDWPVTPYAGTSGWSGSTTSHERALRRDADGSTAGLQLRIAALVGESGAFGLTVAEARDILPEHHGSVSGALSALHLVDRIACLTEKRDGCHPYVLPEYVRGRETRTQGRSEMPNANRQRGDYLERQTRAALRQHGWIVVRAAGSHGPADLVALRRRFTPLLVSCKTDGKISPGERAELRDAAEKADARPLLACRTRRGYVDLHVVYVEGVSDRIDQIKVPPRHETTDDLEGDPDDES